MKDWASPFWEHVGMIGAVAFAVLVALVIVARIWLAGRNRKLAERSIPLLATLGGSRAGRVAAAQLAHRK